MSTYVWTVRSKKSWNKIPAGLEVEVLVNNRTGKPNIKEIQDAIEKKYNIAPIAGMAESLFEFVKK